MGFGPRRKAIPPSSKIEWLEPIPLYCFPNLESLKMSKVDLHAIDIAFVDKNIEESAFNGGDVVNYLRSKTSGKIVLASGEDEEVLKQDPQFSQVDFVVSEKVPTSFKAFFS